MTAINVLGCQVVDYDTVKVYRKPVADFISRPEVLDMNDPLLRCFDQSTFATTWNWNFGDSLSYEYNSNDLQNPTHLYSDSGVYQITLVVSNQNICFDTVAHSIKVVPSFDFYIPNAFSPDGDGTNETFYGKGEGFNINNFEMYIYDRWGKLIYSKTGYDETGWDGTFMNNGKVCENGFYSYLIRLTESGGIKRVYKGVTFLLR